MRPFTYQAVDTIQAAAGAFGQSPGASDSRSEGKAVVLAGGTTLLDLMKLDVMRPSALIDITPAEARLSSIEFGNGVVRIGALAKMSQVADHERINRDFPVVAEALRKGASAQLRNMATMGGNLLQRTRCSYFRDVASAHCNKRMPGSGCDALEGMNRGHAIFGVSDQCIATYPGDFGTAFVALDGYVETLGPSGARTIRASDLHLASGQSPAVETTLRPGEIITVLCIPDGAWARRSAYLKIRDRESYAFALASAAVAMDLREGVVRDVRIGLGGVAGKPWRSEAAEAALRGQRFDEALATRAAQAAFADASLREQNAFKKPLGEKALVRTLLHVAGMELRG